MYDVAKWLLLTCNQLIAGVCAKQDLLRKWDRLLAYEA